jgi:23S rRNA pseudouridine1911/1915/1917 synthase
MFATPQTLRARAVGSTLGRMNIECVTVGDSEGGQRLDRLLALHLATLSRTRLKRLVEAGRVSLDGDRAMDPALRVRPGQIVLVDLPAPVADHPVPQAIALNIVYEDEHVIVIDKPAGMVVHPAPGNADHTLVNALLAHCGDTLAGIGGVKRPGIVHRLDKDTSGLMVAAKTDLAHHELSKAFATHELTRAYIAVVRGIPSPREGTITTRIGRSKSNRKKMAVVEHGGKEAITRYHVLRSFGTEAALLECRLATGRTHQIRVHLAAARHPLVGDPIYGRSPGASLPQEARDFPRQALHAQTLGFRHPADRRELLFSSELPKDMVALIKTLESI